MPDDVDMGWNLTGSVAAVAVVATGALLACGSSNDAPGSNPAPGGPGTDAGTDAPTDSGTKPDAADAMTANCLANVYTPGPASTGFPPTTAVSYDVTVTASNVAVTPPTEATPKPTSHVPPRNATSHPMTLWDSVDISAITSAIRANTNPTLVANFDSLKSLADKRITLTSSTSTFDVYGTSHTLPNTAFTAQGVPIPTMSGGVAQYEGDPTDVSGANAGTIQLLGVVYALTGDASYGEFARQMLISYANYYGQYAHPAGWTTKSYRSALDGRLSYQFLNDAFVLAEFAWGYDLVYDLPAFTSADRTNLRTNLFDAIAAEFSNPIEIVNGADYLSSGNNRSAVSAASVLLAGYACDDQTLVNDALYGTGGSPGNPQTGGGLTVVHWGSNILADGLWVESSLGYQTGIASCGVFDAAIVMEHHGMDVFGQYPLKRLLDSAINITYPDPPMLFPNLGNTGPTALLDSAGWASNEVGMPYEYGYLYYQDPSYLPIIRNASQSLNMTAHAGAPSLFLSTPAGPDVVTASSFSAVSGAASPAQIFAWLQSNGFFRETTGTQSDPIPITSAMTTALDTRFGAQAAGILAVLTKALSSAPPPVVQNVNYYVDGYGLLRVPSAAGASQGINQLLVEYASNTKSHGEPDDMSIDLFALGGQVFSLPGDVFPYNLPIDPSWYWTTVASNTLVVDQGSQIDGSTYDSRTEKPPYVDQIVYGFASTMGIQKVSSNTLFTGVTEDRAVFMTPNYVADVFAGFDTKKHTYDLPWHPIGTLKTSLSLTPRSTTDLTNPGYDSLTNVLHATTDQTWSASITVPSGSTVPFWAAANPGTEVITADGHLYVYGQSKETQPPLFIERQSNVNNAVFSSAVDVSGGQYVTGIDQDGTTSNVKVAVLLRIKHGEFADYAFTSFAQGSFTSADGTFGTDAWQALVLFDDKGALQGMFLGGGTTLSTPYGSLTRVDTAKSGAPGLAYIERTTSGQWVAGNMSPSGATVHVSLPCAGLDESVSLQASSTQTL